MISSNLIHKDINIKLISKKLSTLGKKLIDKKTSNKWRSIIDKKKFQTYADIYLSNEITKFLRGLSINYPIYSEENTPKFKKDHSYWLIDPIDGTSSWYHGYPGFVTQLSLIINNEPSFGLIYWPHKNLSWYCDRSGVIFQNRKKIDNIKLKNNKIRIIDNYPVPNKFLKSMWTLLKNPKYIECGSIGLKTMYVALSKADLFVKDTYFEDWDIAPFLPLTKKDNSFYMLDFKLNKIKLNNFKTHKNGLIVCRDFSIAKKVYEFINN